MKELLYVYLFERIKEQIHMGVFQPGDMLPSEKDLSNQYQMSRITVRKSLSLLEQEGYTYSAPGKGYFIKEPVSNKYILDYEELSSHDGHQFQGKLVEVTIDYPTVRVMKELRISEDHYVVSIQRVLFTGDTPVAFDVKYMPYAKGIPLVEHEIKYATFPELAAKKASLFAIKRELNVKASIADENLAFKLNSSVGKPILTVGQKFFLETNHVLGWGETHYLSEYFELNGKWSFG